MRPDLAPLTPMELKTLANYNAETNRGIMHNLTWQGSMIALQRRFNLAGNMTIEFHETRRWWELWK